MDQDIQLDLSDTPEGKHPYLPSLGNRFQIRVKKQPLKDDLEVSIRFQDTRPQALASRSLGIGFPRSFGPKPETDRDDNIRRSVKRAKKRCRQHLIMASVDRMFTYTVRLSPGQTPLSRAQMLKAWALYIADVKKTDPGFTFVCTMELQKNGQPHIHAGVKGFKNLEKHHVLWCRSLNRVLGRKDSEYYGDMAAGNIDGGVNGFLKKCRSVKNRASRMAGYMAKYMAKDAEYVPFNAKRYFHTIGICIPPALAKWMEEEDMQDAVFKVLAEHGLVRDEGLVTPGVYCTWDKYCAFIVIPFDLLEPPPF